MTDVSLPAPTPRLAFLRRFTWTHLAFVQALIAMSGSLYFSEVMLFPPCTLCWYQRICMYPLVAILGVGIWRRDRKVYVYVLPLALIGFAIALYQCAMTYGFIQEGVCSATSTVSCTIRWINWFGFITIPLLSFVAFSVIALAMVASMTRSADEK